MSFNTGLSGLNAASTDLNVTSNNIANSNTTGFKSSRTEFADVFSLSALGVGSTAVGSGVLANKVAQQFSQGNLNFTESTLDLAISGQGFFVMSDSATGQEHTYTRAGNFNVDKDGNIVNGQGQFLKAFQTNTDGSVKSTSLSTATAVNIPRTAGAPSATTAVDISLNLDSSATALDPTLFDLTDSSTYTSSTSVTAFDSLGNSHITTAYYIKSNVAADLAVNGWEVKYAIDGTEVTQDTTTGHPSTLMTFGTDGKLATPLAANDVVLTTTALGNDAAPLSISFDYSTTGTTQFAAPFAVSELDQDGFTAGRLSGIDLDETGVIRASFSNGQSQTLGKVALAQFNNDQGLKQLGNSSFSETLTSGVPLAGESGISDFGIIRSGALENSNVDITKEMVHLITAQRNFQANARSIETNNQLTQTVINIR
ncbi:MAG: flagellar hook protein FlgE [Methylococcales bacterium]|mgnify:CR=1 FL=1|jgi:flagellar hook protein FlgE|nr:flagellar hook protein FlgE [Methylococcales bacterium]MBT7408733.1 flagellar hook protein FlgE [Methylococcales bacterium]